MSVPLDNLYDFFEGISDTCVVIYRWTNHGSKKLQDLVQHNPPQWGSNQFLQGWVKPNIIFHDQEPLDWNLYGPGSVQEFLTLYRPNIHFSKPLREIWANTNIRAALPPNRLSHVLLAHSDQGGSDLAQYQQNGFLPVFVWSHALIARDWYRFAQHDSRLVLSDQPGWFNIHARAWQGSREYRLAFLDRMLASGLRDKARVSFQHGDQDHLLRSYQFQDQTWTSDLSRLADSYPNTEISSTASAGYDVAEFQQTRIDVVLETRFESSRAHLTEKILRCLACRRPFVLAAGPGSLDWLHRYGFRTFDSIWDESYDRITDPQLRMAAILDVMREVTQLDWGRTQSQVLDICAHNHERFFSTGFHDQVCQEYQNNLTDALQQLEPRPNQLWSEALKIGLDDPTVYQWFNRPVLEQGF